MNNGRICVSIAAQTPDELFRKIEIARKYSDLLELRFDALNSKFLTSSESIKSVFSKISSTFPELDFVVTFRPKKEGGLRELTIEDRELFWNSGISAAYSDKEIDISAREFESDFDAHILSVHDFASSPEFTNDLIESVFANEPDVVKIAVATSDVHEGLSVWDQERIQNGGFVPIAMGIPGQWTRILGPAFGAPFTYASLDENERVAPGQLSVRELDELYRVKELDAETEIYGLIGNPIGHSLSPYMQNSAFKSDRLNAVYIPFEISDLASFVRLMVEPKTRQIDWNLKGFSVTAPFKTEIIEHVDYLDRTAEAIGAVNTVQMVDGKLVGSNTDAAGFIEPLEDAFGSLDGVNVGVFGSGGAARACLWSLKNSGARPMLFVRDVEKARDLSKEFGVELFRFDDWDANAQTIQIAVNTTPLGTLGKLESESPLMPGQMKNLQMVYDLVYNPYETSFLRHASKVGIRAIHGLDMLVSQGAGQYETWTGKKAPIEIMTANARARLT